MQAQGVNYTYPDTTVLYFTFRPSIQPRNICSHARFTFIYEVLTDLIHFFMFSVDHVGVQIQ